MSAFRSTCAGFNPLAKLSVLALAAAASTVWAAEPLIVGVQAPITGQYANEGQGIADAVKLRPFDP